MNKLYYNSPYITQWESWVENITIRDGKYYITLKETAFYPEGGGQPSDRGFIEGVEVEGVIEEDDKIYHIMNTPPVKQTVKCIIDYDRRFDHMQQHSGQHILSAAFYRLHNGRTNSFHLGDDYITIDISIPDIPQSMIDEIEREANLTIYKNLNVKTYIITPEEVSSLPLRKIPPTTENIRVVEIQDTDFSPCCGTHVTKTGEVGIIKILKTEKYKGMTRIYFKCGNRALKDFNSKNGIVLEISRSLSVPESEITERIQGLNNEIENLLKEKRELREKLAIFEAREILSSAQSMIISKHFDNLSFTDIQLISKYLFSEGNYLLILSSVPERRLLFTHNGDFAVNCGKIFKEHLLTYNGKGGGSDKQAQAGFANTEDLIGFQEFLIDHISNGPVQ